MKTIDELLGEWTLIVSLDRLFDSNDASGRVECADEISKNASITINCCQNLKERVVTVLHELLHLDPERDPVGYKLFMDKNIQRAEVNLMERQRLEDSLDTEAHTIFDSRPDIVEHVVNKYNLNDIDYMVILAKKISQNSLLASWVII